jgi:hypothetical protein
MIVEERNGPDQPAIGSFYDSQRLRRRYRFTS